MKKNIYLLGGVSFFTDLASQMIYPLLPQLLVGMGAGPAIIGIIEGVAEATAAFFRGLFGKWTDISNRKKPFLYVGYGLSDIVKPLFYLVTSPWHVLGLRFAERTGKAVRTSARDVIIAHSARPGQLGRSFGFHKGMDKAGALLGPLVAALVLYIVPGDIRLVFLLAFIPAFFGFLFIFPVKETQTTYKSSRPDSRFGLAELGVSFKRFLLVNAVFGLANASNAFLILKAGETGVSVAHVAILWFLYNLSGAISAPLIGRWSDRVKRETVIAISFMWFIAVFIGFAFAESSWMIWGLFGAFGFHYALSKGVFRAFITEIVPVGRVGTAFGMFDMVEGISLLVASVLMGAIWEWKGSGFAFLVHAGLGLTALVLFLVFFLRRAPHLPKDGV